MGVLMEEGLEDLRFSSRSTRLGVGLMADGCVICRRRDCRNQSLEYKGCCR